MIGGINLGKKSRKFVKVQVTSIHLNDRSNTYNQIIEKNGTAERNGKIINVPFVERETLCEVELRIRLLTVWLYGCTT